MPTVKLSPLFNSQTLKSTGVPASGHKINTYAAGSSAALATYTNSTGVTPQANPIILNSNGLPDNEIWLQAGLTYKFIWTDENDVVIDTFDNISGINDTTTSASQWQSSGVTPTYVSTTSFTLPGDQTTEFHVRRRLQFTTTAGTVYGTILTSAYTTLTTVTMTMDTGMTLDSGLSVANLSILRADHSALPNNKETTFTAGITCGTGSVTLGNNGGTYTTMGNMVFFTGLVDISAVSAPANALSITGLPFPSGNNNRNYSAVSLRVSGGTNSIAGNIWQAHIPKNSTSITVTYYDPATGTEGSNPAGQLKAGSSFTFSGFYMVN